MATVQLIHPGYIRDDSRVGSSISLIRDGSAIVVADPAKTAALAAGDYRVELRIDVGLPALLIGETTLKVPK